jgi:hypothetical protein
MRFSVSTQNFYPESIAYPALPVDVVTVSDADFDLAMARAAGQTMAVQNGRIVLVDPPPPSLEEIKAAQLAALQAACDAEIAAGYASAALGAAHTYPTKANDQLNMSASVVASLLPGLPPDWTTPFWCADAAGAWAMREHTAAQIQQAGSDGKAMIQAAQVKLATLSAQVLAAADAATVQAVVW